MKIDFKSKSFTALISIFFAIVFWVFVMSDSTTTRVEDIRNVTINVRGEEELADKGLVVTKKSKANGNMRVEGRANAIGNIEVSHANAYVDVSHISEPGEYELTISANINSSAVMVKSFSPNRIKVTVEKYAEKQVPVEIEYNKDISSKYWINEAKIQNERITVKGGESVVSGVAKGVIKVDTDILVQSYENNSANNYEASLPITFVDENNNEIADVSKHSSIVSVDLLSRKKVKLDVKGAIKGSPAQGYMIESISPSLTEVDVIGEKEILATIDSMSVSPIDVTGVSASKVVDAVIQPVDGTRILGTNKVKVSVNIKDYVEN